ncbi:MAG: septum formation initiator family protein [bacterium]
MRNKRNTQDRRTFGFGHLFKFMIFLISAGFSGLLFVNSARSIMTAYNRSLLLQQAESEVNELRIENLELTEEKDKMVAESYVEAEARDRITYTKKGEKIVVLPNTGEEVVLGEEDIVEEEDDGPKGWNRWWEIVKNGV